MSAVLGGLLTPLAAVLALLWFTTAVSQLSSGRIDEGRRTLENSLRRAAVACYAAEGVYPPDLGYLERHYGVQVDEEHYAVDYQAFASNLMPDITVLEK